MKRCRLIYKSLRKPKLLPNSDVKELTEKAAENNEKDGITGLLLLSGDHFLQVLEGPVKFVNQLYVKIIADERHDNVELISYEGVTTSYFHDWSMKEVILDQSLSIQQREVLMNKYSQDNGHIRIPDDLLRVYGLLLDARWGLLNKK